MTRVKLSLVTYTIWYFSILYKNCDGIKVKLRWFKLSKILIKTPVSHLFALDFLEMSKKTYYLTMTTHPLANNNKYISWLQLYYFRSKFVLGVDYALFGKLWSWFVRIGWHILKLLVVRGFVKWFKRSVPLAKPTLQFKFRRSIRYQ